MTQRNVELLIGQLLTDEERRLAFLDAPERFLRELVKRGTHLTESEMAALMATDPNLWHAVADRLDSRLQKAQMRMPWAEVVQRQAEDE